MHEPSINGIGAAGPLLILILVIMVGVIGLRALWKNGGKATKAVMMLVAAMIVPTTLLVVIVAFFWISYQDSTSYTYLESNPDGSTYEVQVNRGSTPPHPMPSPAVIAPRDDTADPPERRLTFPTVPTPSDPAWMSEAALNQLAQRSAALADQYPNETAAIHALAAQAIHALDIVQPEAEVRSVWISNAPPVSQPQQLRVRRQLIQAIRELGPALRVVEYDLPKHIDPRAHLNLADDSVAITLSTDPFTLIVVGPTGESRSFQTTVREKSWVPNHQADIPTPTLGSPGSPGSRSRMIIISSTGDSRSAEHARREAVHLATEALLPFAQAALENRTPRYRYQHDAQTIRPHIEKIVADELAARRAAGYVDDTIAPAERPDASAAVMIEDVFAQRFEHPDGRATYQQWLLLPSDPLSMEILSDRIIAGLTNQEVRFESHSIFALFDSHAHRDTTVGILTTLGVLLAGLVFGRAIMGRRAEPASRT